MSDRRLDLDDLGGEVCLLDWGKGPGSHSSLTQKLEKEPVHGFGSLTITLAQESLVKFGKFQRRLIPLENNPLILPLPPTVHDPVGKDLQDVAKICSDIQESWNDGTDEVAILNRFSFLGLARSLDRRMSREAKESAAARANAVDVLITGCEVR